MNEEAKTSLGKRAITRTVSMPADLWDVFDAHAVKIDGDRSSCMQRLAREELRSHGLLPESKEEAVAKLFRAVIEVIGVDALKAELHRISARQMTERAEVCHG